MFKKRFIIEVFVCFFICLSHFGLGMVWAGTGAEVVDPVDNGGSNITQLLKNYEPGSKYLAEVAEPTQSGPEKTWWQTFISGFVTFRQVATGILDNINAVLFITEAVEKNVEAYERLLYHIEGLVENCMEYYDRWAHMERWWDWKHMDKNIIHLEEDIMLLGDRIILDAVFGTEKALRDIVKTTTDIGGASKEWSSLLTRQYKSSKKFTVDNARLISWTVQGKDVQHERLRVAGSEIQAELMAKARKAARIKQLHGADSARKYLALSAYKKKNTGEGEKPDIEKKTVVPQDMAASNMFARQSAMFASFTANAEIADNIEATTRLLFFNQQDLVRVLRQRELLFMTGIYDDDAYKPGASYIPQKSGTDGGTASSGTTGGGSNSGEYVGVTEAEYIRYKDSLEYREQDRATLIKNMEIEGVDDAAQKRFLNNFDATYGEDMLRWKRKIREYEENYVG